MVIYYKDELVKQINKVIREINNGNNSVALVKRLDMLRSKYFRIEQGRDTFV
jgi:hypothetical protein